MLVISTDFKSFCKFYEKSKQQYSFKMSHHASTSNNNDKPEPITKEEWQSRLESFEFKQADMNKLIMNYLVTGEYKFATIKIILQFFFSYWIFVFFWYRKNLQKDLKMPQKSFKPMLEWNHRCHWIHWTTGFSSVKPSKVVAFKKQHIWLTSCIRGYLTMIGTCTFTCNSCTWLNWSGEFNTLFIIDFLCYRKPFG